MTEPVRAFLERQGFAPGRSDLETVAEVFVAEAERALRGESSSLQMIDSRLAVGDGGTPVSPAPLVVVDAGGTNLRVAAVRLTGDGPVFSHLRKSEMPGTHGVVSAEAFHAAIAAEVDAVRADEPQAVAIGYCFSYSCRPLPDGDAELLSWSKQVEAPEVVGQRVGAELVRRLAGGSLPVVVLNDTVATLMAGLSRQGGSCPGQVGLILGTGTNLACVEDGTIVNAETGECDRVPRTPCDESFDATLPDAGAALFEKMVSGAYLGGVGLQLLKAAVRDGLLKGVNLEEVSASACELDALAVGDAARPSPLTGVFPPDELPVAREIVRAVFRRAALLTAAHLAAFVRRSAEGGRTPVRITVDGSAYWKVRSVDFDGIVRKTLADLVPGVPFEVFRADEAPMVGAAVAAARFCGRRTGSANRQTRRDGDGDTCD